MAVANFYCEPSEGHFTILRVVVKNKINYDEFIFKMVEATLSVDEEAINFEFKLHKGRAWLDSWKPNAAMLLLVMVLALWTRMHGISQPDSIAFESSCLCSQQMGRDSLREVRELLHKSHLLF